MDRILDNYCPGWRNCRLLPEIIEIIMSYLIEHVKTNFQDYYLYDGKREGEFVSKHLGGSIKERMFYWRGVPHGECKIFYIDTLHLHCSYNRGMLEGPYIVYHENGQIERSCIYANDYVANNHKVYNEDGSLAQSIVIQDGQSIRKEWKGRKLVRYDLTDLTANNGVSYMWYSNGQLESAWNCKNGLMHGESTLWHKNGNIKVREYHNTSGEFKYWYSNGQLKEEFYFDIDIGGKKGEHKTWYRDGRPKMSRFYYNGKLEGKQTDWNGESNIVSITMYHNGAKEG